MAVVEVATVTSVVTKATTMLVTGLILSVLTIGFFCWLIFTLAIYALASFVGLTAGMTAFHSGLTVICALFLRGVPLAHVTIRRVASLAERWGTHCCTQG